MGRFDRHRPLLSEDGWSRLRDTPAVLAGVGGLGTNVAMLLVRLGVQEFELWDPAVVDEPDLNRQILYGEADLGRAKVDAAAERLRAINGTVTVRPVGQALDARGFGKLTACADRGFVVFDCLDSFAARASLAELQQRFSRPVFHGGVDSWYGQVTTLLPGGGGYTRAFGADYASQSGPAKPIMPHVVAAVASFEVGEFVRWCDSPEHTPLSDALLFYDGRSMSTRSVRLGQDDE